MYGDTKIKKDERKGYEYLKKASDMGESRVMYLLGLYNLDGYLFIKKDPVAGFNLLKKAASRNSKEALNLLSYCYSQVVGTTKSFKLAHQSIDKAIALSEPNSWSIPFGLGLVDFLDTKGEIYLLQGDKVNARKMWDKCIELDSNWAKRETTLYKGLFK